MLSNWGSVRSYNTSSFITRHPFKRAQEAINVRVQSMQCLLYSVNDNKQQFSLNQGTGIGDVRLQFVHRP